MVDLPDGSMKKNSLSLCMIVRDGEKTLGRALASVQDIVDEMVVVDTGSTDNTLSIAESFRARIIEFPWIDDFSAARNIALEAAVGDWILILDSDETLEAIDIAVIRSMLDDSAALAYYAKIREIGPGVPEETYESVRLFRSYPQARYRFPVHEQIAPALLEIGGQDGRSFLRSDLGIEHSGSSNRKENKKDERNKRLLRKVIAEDPKEPFFHFLLAREFAVYLADEIMPVRGFTQLICELEIAVELMDQLSFSQTADSGYGAEAYALLTSAYLSANRSADALATSERGIDRFGEPSSLQYFHGRALLAMATGHETRSAELRKKGIDRLEKLRAEKGKTKGFDPTPVSNRHVSLYSLRYLGLAAIEEGRLDDGRAHFQEALKIDPAYTGAYCGLARLADHQGQVVEAMKIYIEVLKINQAEWAAWREGADLLKRMGRDEDAGKWLSKLQLILPECRIAVSPGVPLRP